MIEIYSYLKEKVKFKGINKDKENKKWAIHTILFYIFSQKMAFIKCFNTKFVINQNCLLE